jgi:hypothetical protein
MDLYILFLSINIIILFTLIFLFIKVYIETQKTKWFTFSIISYFLLIILLANSNFLSNVNISYFYPFFKVLGLIIVIIASIFYLKNNK